MKRTLTLFAFLLLDMVYGQAPNISYASPQSYSVGKAITPLAPNNTGGAVASGTTVSLLAGRTPGQDGTAANFLSPNGVVVDATGNVYVADGHKIRKINPAGVVTTLAGSETAGAKDGTGTAASFSNPIGLAVDAAGNIYVADIGNQKIRKITAAGVVTTLAGSGTQGAADGTGTAASFYNPYGVAVDALGNVYVADTTNHKIRKITAAGVVTTFAGSGSIGAIDAAGTAASFKYPNDVAVDAAGNVYVVDTYNHKIRKITAAGVVTTLAGSGTQGSYDATGTSASFNTPVGIALDASGNVYVSEYANHKIRKITAAKVVTTLAGSGTEGEIDGSGAGASFNYPRKVSVDAAGNVYVADTFNYKIRKITPAGVVTTWAGSGIAGATDGIGTAASFNNPTSIAVDATGNVYVADYYNNKIRKITAAGVVTTLAGSGTQGATDGTGIAASFKYPHSVAVDALGNVYVADRGNQKIRKITAAGVVTTYAGSGSIGAIDGIGTAASFNYPRKVSVDAAGNVYVADTDNHKIRKITAAGVVTTLAGSGSIGAIDGIGTAARFNNPTGVAVDAAGNVFVADSYNHKIRKINAAGVVTTLAGNGTQGAADGTGIAASFSNPSGLAVDMSGNVYVADTGNHKIRKITQVGGYRINPTLPAGLLFDQSSGVISGTPTVATPITTYTITTYNNDGNSITTISLAVVNLLSPNISYPSPQTYTVGSAITPLAPTNTGGAVVSVVSSLAGRGPANDGPGVYATFNKPYGIAADLAGNMYVADKSSHKIRKISPEGIVTTFAGVGINGNADGTASSARFDSPSGVAVDASGFVYITDTNNHKIRKISPGGEVTTYAGSGSSGSTDGIGTAASFNEPTGLAVDAAGNVYVADTGNHKIRKISPTGEVTTLAGNGDYNSTDGASIQASFGYPKGVAVDANGNVYVADSNNNKIRKINPIGEVTTLAGNGEYNSTDGAGTTASFSNPSGVAVDIGGNVYVADSNNNKIRKISATGEVSTLAGSGGLGNSIDGIGTAASFDVPSGLAIDVAGNVYVADTFNDKIRKISSSGTVTTYAGNSSWGSDDGKGAAASFSSPKGISVDVTGNVYVADSGNLKIRKITATGVVTTLAGNGSQGGDDGIDTAASFNSPEGLAVDAAGNVYVADTNNHKIRKINPTGLVTTLAGDGTPGSMDGTSITASFSSPSGVAVDISGNVYVADSNNNKIRKISATGEVSTLAGSGIHGSDDGIGTAASFSGVFDIEVDKTGALYVADMFNHRIRKINPEGVVTTLAGSHYGNVDGTVYSASFAFPYGITVDATYNVYLSDQNNDKIRKIAQSGYHISPSLPAGLNLDTTTGIISGTPTAASPMTTYTVTAYNADGSATTTIEMGTAVLGTESFSRESLILFPNPAHNLIQIQSKDNLTIDKVIITDLTGKVIIEQALDTNTINIAQLASGMYIIKAFSGQQAFTSKFMKAL